MRALIIMSIDLNFDNACDIIDELLYELKQRNKLIIDDSRDCNDDSFFITFQYDETIAMHINYNIYNDQFSIQCSNIDCDEYYDNVFHCKSIDDVLNHVDEIM